MASSRRKTPKLPRRVRVARAYARKLVNASAQIDYSQTRSRPMTYPGPQGIPRFLDCSSAVTTIYEAGGFPDPNGRDFDGHGYTGTLVSHGRSVSKSEIQPLDLVFYGSSSERPGFPAGSPTHVAMVMDRKGAIFTFGSDPGPSFRRIDYRSDFHSVRRYIRDLFPDDV
jgi:hypothetical protein